MAESYLDRPQDDNTPQAHPAFKRGKISGVATVLRIVKNIIDGVDTGQGVNNSPQIEAIRRAVLEYKQTLEKKESKSSKQALKNAESLVAKIKF